MSRPKITSLSGFDIDTLTNGNYNERVYFRYQQIEKM